MTLYLHIGSHKTGTTATQGFARANGEWLDSQNLYYSSYDLIGGARTQSHLRVVRGLLAGADDPENPERQMLSKMREMMQSKGVDVLFSAESLFRLRAEDREVFCRIVKEEMGDEKIVVVASLRHPLEFADSMYRNAYRAYKEVPSGASRMLITGPLHLTMDYNKIIQAYKTLLGADTKLLPYTSETRKTFVSDFFAALGVGGEFPETEVKIKNRSLNALACLTKKIALGNDVSSESSKTFNNFAAKYIPNTDYTFLSPGLQQKVLDLTEASTQALVEAEPALEGALRGPARLSGTRPVDETARRLAATLADQFATLRNK